MDTILQIRNKVSVKTVASPSVLKWRPFLAISLPFPTHSHSPPQHSYSFLSPFLPLSLFPLPFSNPLNLPFPLFLSNPLPHLIQSFSPSPTLFLFLFSLSNHSISLLPFSNPLLLSSPLPPLFTNYLYWHSGREDTEEEGESLKAFSKNSLCHNHCMFSGKVYYFII